MAGDWVVCSAVLVGLHAPRTETETEMEKEKEKEKDKQRHWEPAFVFFH
jgi:hypothetical protein